MLHDEPETGGYGAYSYILFKQLPTGERAEALLEAYCGQLPPVSDYAKADPAKLNITYIPVDVEPSASENSDIKWFGQHYDLSRSKAILLSQKLRGAGPYIVTSSRPLTGESLPVRTSSVIDLSMATTKESMQLWVAQFVKVSESPDDWLSHGADSVALKVHDALAILGKSTKLVLSVLPDGRKFLKAMLGG